ncbi:MAG: rod shape-determining protein RodA [Porphyromonas sp.]|nr:rod shape-determining protein RodA [Porphyromonas sp.]
MEDRINPFKQLDYLTLLIYVLLVAVGWLTISSATYEIDNAPLLDFSGRAGAQLVWIGATLLIGGALMFIDLNLIKSASFYLYVLMLLVLLLTIFIAPEIKGSRSWIAIGSFRIQPAEFSKMITAMGLAAWMARYEFDLRNKKEFLVAALICFAPILLIIAQNETGSAVAFFGLILVFYREGLSALYLLLITFVATFVILAIRFSEETIGTTNIGLLLCFSLLYIVAVIMALRYIRVQKLGLLCLGIPFISGIGFGIASFFLPINWAWIPISSCILLALAGVSNYLFRRHLPSILIVAFMLSSAAIYSSVDYFFYNILQPHQQIRIRSSLGMEDDPKGIGYNVNQSKIAIGSGGLFGKGFHNGTQTKLKYVPEQETDFIFSTIGEEQGFIGASAVLLLFLTLVWRLLIVADRQSTIYGRVYGYSVASFFIFHIVINIGMVLGITPVIGIPLPFFSYGGSSMLSFSLLIFLLLKIDAANKPH